MKFQAVTLAIALLSVCFALIDVRYVDSDEPPRLQAQRTFWCWVVVLSLGALAAWLLVANGVF